MELLLERDAELEALDEMVVRAAAGHGCLGLVCGEAGIGKTSLVRALRERVGARVSFLLGSCEPLSVPVPLAPLRELTDAAGSDVVAEIVSGDRLALARAVLAALRRHGPACAVIEDAHWADPTTLDVLRLLVRRIEDESIAILVTYRDDEVAANLELGRLLGRVATNPATTRLVLKPLSRQAVAQLAAPGGADPERIARITGGNPFLVVESIAAGEGVPASVRDATLARASRLDPSARAVVDAAAVIGQRVDPEVLQAVAGGGTSAVEEALARGVMVADGDMLGFRHELIRGAIESSIPPPRRAQLHADVVAALAQRPRGADNARLAHHAECAGLVAEACRYATLASAEAERLGALEEMRRQTERALRLGADLPAGDRADLLVRCSRGANFSGALLQDAVQLAESAVELARELGDRVREGRALTALAYALWPLDRAAEAAAAAERAVQLLAQTSDVAELARAQATHIRMQATTLDPGLAIRSAPQALELAARAGLQDTRIDLEISLGLARGHSGDGGALAMLDAAHRAARRAELTIQTIRCCVNRVFVGALLRRHEYVDFATTEALAIFDLYQTRFPRYAVEIFSAQSQLDRGRWTQARAIAARMDPDWTEAPVARWIEAVIDARIGTGDPDAVLERALEAVAHVPEGSRHGQIRLALVEAAWLRGDRSAALRHLRSARESPVTTRFARWGGELALWASRYGVALQPPAGAPEPVLLELAGEWRGAVDAWRAVDAPYEAALAALPGDDRAARAAMGALRALGARAAMRAFAREREARGGRPPRGPRNTTLAHPAGLTRREQEILELVATAATNAEIAATLHLSGRTVAHHVSSILAKLGAANRIAAIELARARGLLAEN